MKAKESEGFVKII